MEKGQQGVHRLLLKEISSRKMLFDPTLSEFQIYHEKGHKSDFSLITFNFFHLKKACCKV